jgi:MFS family permease
VQQRNPRTAAEENYRLGRAPASELQWIVDAYALAFGALMLVAGSLAARVGRKRTFIAGWHGAHQVS